jgi:hypothetical protein
MVSAAGRAGVGVREGTVDVTVGDSVRDTVLEKERDLERLRESVALRDAERETDVWPPTRWENKNSSRNSVAIKNPSFATMPARGNKSGNTTWNPDFLKHWEV